MDADAGPRGHVVVGVDGSRYAERALERAVREARRRAVPLEVLHGRPWARPPDPGARRGGSAGGAPSPEDARVLAESAAARARGLAPGLTVLASPTDEDATAALVRLSRRARLTVVGSRGLGGFAGLLLGSVSLRVAAHAGGPLLVVRGDLPPEDDRAGGGTVLLGLGGDADGDAVAVAFEEAAARHAGLTVLHAWTYRHFAPPGDPLVPTLPVHEDIARLARSEAVAAEETVAGFREEYPQVHARVRTVREGAAHALVEASREADVVVLAAHRHRGPLALRLDPVVHAVLHHAHCPVLLVPVPRGTGDGGAATP